MEGGTAVIFRQMLGYLSFSAVYSALIIATSMFVLGAEENFHGVCPCRFLGHGNPIMSPHQPVHLLLWPFISCYGHCIILSVNHNDYIHFIFVIR